MSVLTGVPIEQVNFKENITTFGRDQRNQPLCAGVRITRPWSGVPPGRGGGTLGISGWGCAAGTLESLAYTRASSAEFCYPILD